MIQALIQFSLRVPALNFLVMHHESLTETGYCNIQVLELSITRICLLPFSLGVGIWNPDSGSRPDRDFAFSDWKYRDFGKLRTP